MKLNEVLGFVQAPKRAYNPFKRRLRVIKKQKAINQYGQEQEEFIPKPRPKGTLWFDIPELWYADLNNHYTTMTQMCDDNDNMFMVNDRCDMCYGAWYKDKNRGVTFFKPRPLHTVTHPTIKLVKRYE